MSWHNIQKLGSKSYVCGYCGNPLASENGYFSSSPAYRIYICHFCNKATFFDEKGDPTPGQAFGDAVSGITDSGVEKIYGEARQSMKNSSPTAAVLCCRKLLMHIAVSKGAKEGETFIYYVQFLSDNHYIPPGAEGWVDHIRDKGNEANHEIVISTEEEAKRLIQFCGMLLKMIFEFPSKVPKKVSK